jgi:hypothetical protein
MTLLKMIKIWPRILNLGMVCLILTGFWIGQYDFGIPCDFLVFEDKVAALVFKGCCLSELLRQPVERRQHVSSQLRTWPLFLMLCENRQLPWRLGFRGLLLELSMQNEKKFWIGLQLVFNSSSIKNCRLITWCSSNYHFNEFCNSNPSVLERQPENQDVVPPI